MKLHQILYFFLTITLLSCQETTDFYLGIPLQPRLEEDNYEPGLNIIGILRPDGIDSLNSSFVHVQQVAPAVGNYPEFSLDSMLITDAEVKISTENSDTNLFSYTDHGEIFDDYQYRPSSEFMVEPGSEYNILCTYEGLPALTSSTKVPLEPLIYADSVTIQNGIIQFVVEIDLSAFMYEVYLLNKDDIIGFKRIVPDHQSNTSIELNTGGSDSAEVIVYAYDFNLATYNATSNTSLNFNKYRKAYGNVEGGYGVFGSLNFTSFRF